LSKYFATLPTSTLLDLRYYCLYGAALLLPVTFFLGKSGRVSFFPTYIIALCVLSLVASHEVRQVVKQNQLSLGLVTLFLTYLALSSVDQSFRSSALFLSYGLLILCFVISLSVLEQRFKDFFDVFLLITVLSACLSVCYAIYVFHALDYQPLVEPRLYALGGLYNPVVSALSYGAITMLALSRFASTQNPRKKILWGVSITILLTGLIYTGTRSVWIGLFVACFSLLYLLPDLSASRKRRITIIAQLCLIVTMAILWKFGFHEEILRRSTSFRIEIWTEVLSSVFNGPYIFGHGLNAVETIHYQDFIFEHPHSIYFATLFYGGLVGLGLLLGLIGHLYWIWFRTEPKPYLIYALPLMTYGLVCLSMDGDKLLTKINFVWLLVWLPYAIALVQTTLPKVREEIGNEAIEETIDKTVAPASNRSGSENV